MPLTGLPCIRTLTSLLVSGCCGLSFHFLSAELPTPTERQRPAIYCKHSKISCIIREKKQEQKRIHHSRPKQMTVLKTQDAELGNSQAETDSNQQPTNGRRITGSQIRI